MGPLYMFMIALGLSMDSFASSFACGTRGVKGIMRAALKVSAVFAIVQTAMTAIGYLLGSLLFGWITRAGPWITFALLMIVGIRMVHESFKARRENRECRHMTNPEIIAMGFATSIDAFVIGTGIAILGAGIIPLLAFILITTFVLSAAGVLIGIRSSSILGFAAEIAGGVILMCIGIWTLSDHLLF
ncbi:MAG: manganese efflux pump [Candidatus Thermoplasmatota archaeon]|nr:manganese efflux pump [Candidatus Thermoplasmatota archaeon]